MASEPSTAALMPIGDEILRGETTDTNSAFLAAELTARGVQVRRIVTVPDEIELIVVEMRAAAAAHDYVISTGGIGPTPDDLTREALALAFGLPLELNEPAVAEYSDKLGRDLNPGQLEMCRLPRGCTLISNPSTGPPGCRLHNFYMLPGVPGIMRVMWEGIKGEFHGLPEHTLSFLASVPESRFAALMTELCRRYPAVKFGSYPRQKGLGWEVEIRLRSLDEALLLAARADFEVGLASIQP